MCGLEDELRELRRERDLLKALIDATPHFFVAIDADGKTRLMNPAMLRALGYEEEEVIGTDYIQTFVPAEDREDLAGVLERIEKRQRTLSENHVLTKEGQNLLVEWHGTPMFDELGEFAYLFGIGTDITERRHRDQWMMEREARYRLLLEHVPDAIVLADHEGEILDANETAASLLGYRRREIRERMIGEVRLPEPEEWDGEDPPASRTVGTRLLHRDGSYIPREINVIPFRAGSRMCCAYLLGSD